MTWKAAGAGLLSASTPVTAIIIFDWPLLTCRNRHAGYCEKDEVKKVRTNDIDQTIRRTGLL